MASSLGSSLPPSNLDLPTSVNAAPSITTPSDVQKKEQDAPSSFSASQKTPSQVDKEGDHNLRAAVEEKKVSKAADLLSSTAESRGIFVSQRLHSAPRIQAKQTQKRPKPL